MAKANMLCPFSHRPCTECPLYRGRHYYLCFNRKYRGYISGTEGKLESKPITAPRHIDFAALNRMVEPWSEDGFPPETMPEIRLKVIDMETGETEICDPEKAKTWDWDNPETVQIVDGLHITSWQKALQLLHHKAKKGQKEVVIYKGRLGA